MANKRMQNVDHLRFVAYSDATNLNARIAFWQLYGESRDAAFSSFFDRLESDGDTPETADILDIGCGPAHYWEWGLDHIRIPATWTATLTDISQGMLDEAKNNLSKFTRVFTFDIADVCDLKYEDESFDIVTANYMLYHASSQDKALSEISRVLKPGGRLYAKTNSGHHIVEFLDLQRKFIAGESQAQNIGVAHEAFTLENGEAMIKPHFSSVETIRDDSICKATDAQIVIDYANSMDAQLDQQGLEAEVREQITQNGHFKVTRSSGMFVAQK
ncbi:MAG: class I SAM-dependent methyltransferase [Chloroflexi bacterium]|jgi:ubiquinone/menaquinone biosynthesis C-methylase UbiE|nr:class I SAM-dependent methyltransferase [Chloroflexota bacterium]